MARAAQTAALAAGLALGLALAVALVGVVWLERALTPERVARELGARLGREVQVAAVELAWTPAPRLRLEGLRAPPAAELARVEVAASPAALLRGRLEPARLELEGGQIGLVLEGGDVRLAGTAPGAGAGGLDAAALPEIVLREVEIELAEAGAGDAEPVITRVAVEALDLEQRLLAGDVALRARMHLGAGRDEGTLQVRGSATVRGSLEESPLSLELELEDLHPHHLLPRLPPRFATLAIDGRLDAAAQVEGSLREGLEVELALALPEGRLEAGELQVAGGSRLEAQLQWRRGVAPALEGRLVAGEVRLGHRRATGVEVELRHAGDVTEIRALSLDTLEVVREEGARKADVGLHAHVARSGRIALRSVPDRPGLLLGASELEATDLELVVRAGDRRPVGLRVVSLSLRGLAEGGRARGSAEVILAEAGGRLRVEAESAPLPARPDLDSVPLTVTLHAEAVRPARLAPLAPEAWRLRATDAQLAARADLAGSLGTGLRGPLLVTLERGELAAGAFALGAPAELTAEADATESRLELAEARLGASRVGFEGHRAREAQLRGSWQGGVLSVVSLSLQGYEGSIDLADADRAPDLALSVSGAERLVLGGALRRWPFGGADWLRVPAEASVRGLDATVRDLARDVTVPLRVEEASWRHDGRAAPITLAGSARVDGDGGRVSLVAELAAPDGGALEARALRADVEALDAAWVLPYLASVAPLAGPDAARSGDLGPLTGSADLARDGRGAPLAGPFAVSAQRGALAAGRLTLGAPVEARGRITLGEARTLRDGRLRAAWAELAGWRTGALDGSLAFADGALTLSPLSVDAFGGAWTARGLVRATDPPSFALDVTVAGAWLERIAARGAATPEVTEPIRLDGNGHLEGSWTGGPRWLDPIGGDGRFELRGGFVPSEKLWRALASGMMRLVPGISLAPGDVHARLDSASFPWRIRDGLVEADPIEAHTSDYDFSGRGRLDAAWKVAVRGDLSLTATGLDRLLARAPVADPVRRALRLPPIPLRVEGPITDVAVHADVSRLPVATLRTLLGLPGRAVDAVRGAGESVLELPGRILRPRRTGEEGEVPEPAPGPGEPAAPPPDPAPGAP